MADEPTGPVPSVDNAPKDEVKSEVTEASKTEGSTAPAATTPEPEKKSEVEAPAPTPEPPKEDPKKDEAPAAEPEKEAESEEADPVSEPLNDDDVVTSEVKKLTPEGLSKLGYELGEAAVEKLEGMLSGAAEDIKAFGKEIGKDLVQAVRGNDDEWRKELLMQIRQLVSIHKLGLKETAWKIFEDAIAAIIKAARGALAKKGITI